MKGKYRHYGAPVLNIVQGGTEEEVSEGLFCGNF